MRRRLPRLSVAALLLAVAVCALPLLVVRAADPTPKAFVPLIVRGQQTPLDAGGGDGDGGDGGGGAIPNAPQGSGEGTYYDATGAGNCSYEPSPNNLMVAAMNQIDYANSQICGAFVEATGPKGTVVVRIVDRCPECKKGDIDFSPQAFEKIANLVQGRVPITWRVISPPANGPMAFRFKEGSSQWWTAVQVRNHRNPVAKLEYRNASGQWANVPRLEYNYFVAASGMGSGPYAFRVTDIYGAVLVEENIPLRVAQVVVGKGQFPAP
jgi:expansin